MDEPRAELLDYLAVLWRRRWLVILGTLGSVLAAAAVTAVFSKVYRVEATIDAGDLGEPASRAVERLIFRLNAGAWPAGSPSSDAGPPALAARFVRGSLIELALDTTRPAEAVPVVERAAAELVAELNRLLALERRRRDATRQWAEELVRWMERPPPEPAGKNGAGRPADDIAAAASALTALHFMDPFLGDTRPARVVRAPRVPSAPIRPRLMLNLTVGLVLGLLATVFLACFLDHVAEARRLRAKPA